MSFNRLDDLRSSLSERRGRSFFRRGGSSNGESSPLSSPLFKRKQFSFNNEDGFASGPASLASSRESSCDRAGARFHDIVERVRSSPKLNLKHRLAVMRSGSFSSSPDKAEDKRKKFLISRSESLRSPSPWSSPEVDRRGSLPPLAPPLGTPTRNRSLDRVQRMERRGLLQHSQSLRGDDGEERKVKGFVNR